MSRVRVGCADHHRFDPGAEDFISARAGPAFGGTRFKGDVERRIPRSLTANASKAFDLSVRFPGLAMVPAPDDSIVRDQNRAHRRVRTCAPQSLSRFAQRDVHESFVIVHRILEYSS